MALTPRATHTLQWPAECDAWRQRLANREGRSQCRLGAATRPHEGGVASNRVSAERGEYVPGPCTHRPSRHGSREHLKSVGRPAVRWEAAAEGGPGEIGRAHV